MTNRLRTAVQLVAIGTLGLLLTGPAAAVAAPTDSTATATPVPAVSAVPAAPAPPDIKMSDIVMVPSSDELRRTKDEARALENNAQNDQSAAREREARYRAKGEIRKSEIDATKTRIDMAKKDKNKDLQSSLEGTKKRQELELQLYQKMTELEKTNAEVAETARQYARSRQNSCDALSTLGEKYGARQSLLSGGAPEKLVQVERQVRESEKKAIESMKEAASKQTDWYNKQKDLIDRRMDAFNALSALLAL